MKQKRKNILGENDQDIHKLADNFQQPKICATGVSQIEGGWKIIEKTLAKIFPNLIRLLKLQIQKLSCTSIWKKEYSNGKEISKMEHQEKKYGIFQ